MEKRQQVTILLLATLVLVGAYPMLTPKANALVFYTFQSKHFNGVNANFGQIQMDGAPKYNLPATAPWLPGIYSLTYYPAANYFVKWLSSTPAITFGNPTSASTMVSIAPDAGEGTITAIYQQLGSGSSVGGVIVPTNTLAALAPYLALIGLVTTAGIAVAVKRKSKA